MSAANKIRIEINEPPARRPSLKLNALSNWVVLAVNVIIGFLLTPYIISSIGKEGYGIWRLIASFIGYFGLLRFGVGSAIIRYVPLYDGRSEHRRVCGTVSTALSIYVGIGFLILLISFFGSGFLAGFFGEGRDFMLLVKLVGLAAAIECPVAILDATIRAREKYVGANLLRLCTSLFRAISIFVVLWLGYGFVGMGWVTVATAVISLLLSIVGLFKFCQDIRISISDIQTSYARELFSFGIFVTLAGLGLLLVYQSDKVIIGKFINMEVVGIYSVVAIMMFYYRELSGVLARILVPRFGYLDGLGNQEQKVALFLKSSNAVTNIASGIGVVLLLVGPSFIRLWVGPGFESAYQALFVLGIAHILYESQTPSTSILAGSGKQGTIAAFAIIEGISVVILSVLLVQGYGLTGVAVAIAIPMVVIGAVTCPLYVCYAFNIKMSEYYLKCILKPWALLVLFGLGGCLLRPQAFLTSWTSLVVFSMIVGFMYALASYHFALRPEVKRVAEGLMGHMPFSKDLSSLKTRDGG